MAKRVKQLFLMAVMIAFCAGTVSAADDTIRVGFAAEPYPPFTVPDASGNWTGWEVEIIDAVCQEAGLNCELAPTAWDGIIPALLTQKFDIIMSGMTLTQQRNMQINFADPYIVIGQTILIRKELAGKVENYQDLNDPQYTLGSKLGTTGEQATKRMIPRAEYISYETEQEGILELVNGKIDAFIYDLPYNAAAFVQRGQGKLVHLDTPFTYEPLAWAVRKGDYDFINWLNNFLNQARNDGTYEKIYAKWFKDDAWMKELQ